MTVLVAITRLAQFLGATLLLGAPLTFRPLSAPPARARALVLAAAGLALLATVAAVPAQTAVMAGDPAAAIDPRMVWTVLGSTGFGRAVGVRAALFVLILLAVALARPRISWSAIALLGAAAIASFAWSGHGAADEGARGLVHLSADIAHLLAAGVWLGALAALLLMLLASGEDASSGALFDLKTALERFSGVGAAVVAVLLLSGLVNSWFLVGPAHVRDLFRTAYGQLLVAKVTLFAGMLVLAALNRFRLTPALARRLDAGASVAALRASLGVETLLGILVLAAVALLGAIAPLSAQ